MAKTDKEYWAERAEQILLEAERNAEPYLDELNAVYQRTAKSIEQEMRHIFDTYRQGMSEEEALSWLGEYIPRSKYEALKNALASIGDERLRKQVLLRLNAPAYRWRITRLDYLRQSILAELSQAADRQLEVSKTCFTEALRHGYSRTMYELQRGLGLCFELAGIPESTMSRLLSAQWYGRNFAASVWRNTSMTAAAAGRVIREGVLAGQSIRDMSKELMDKTYTTSMYNAARLVRTETNYFENQGALAGYKEAGIERYEFIATLDLRTSEVCQMHDGKTYPVEKAVPGENCPPLHPHCRSTIAAVIDVPELEKTNRRAARDANGRTVDIANMSYAEWKNTYAKATLPKIRREKPAKLQKTLESSLFNGVLPSGAELSSLRLFAGMGVSEKIRVAEHLADKYGGEPWKWQKKGAILESKYYRYDVHWFEYDGVQYELTIKGAKRRED